MAEAVSKAENKGDEGQGGMGCGSCRVSMLHCKQNSFDSEGGGNQQRVLYLCLRPSNSHPIQKPERERASRGHRADLGRTVLLGWRLASP